MRWYKSPNWIQNVIWILFGIFVLAPIIGVFVKSFENVVIYRENHLYIWIRNHFSLQQYKELLIEGIEYWAAYWNTILLTVPTMMIALAVSSLAAYGMMIGCSKWQHMYVVLALIPMQVLLVPQLLIVTGLNLTGMRWTVILIACCSPWYAFFLYRICKQISKTNIEAARIEGAGEFRIFVHIVLPQLRPGVWIFSVIVSADLWSMIEEPLVFIQEESKYPLSVFFQEAGMQVSDAGLVIFALPVFILFIAGIRKVLQEVE